MSSYVKTPTVYQMEATECGAASLSMIFQYFGKNITLEQMRIETGVSRDGCNAASISRYALKYGILLLVYRKDPEALYTFSFPCILYWTFIYFIFFEDF